MDAADEDYYVKMLENWEDHEKRLKNELKETEQRLTSQVDKAHQGIDEKINQTENRMINKLDEIKDFCGEANAILITNKQLECHFFITNCLSLL